MNYFGLHNNINTEAIDNVVYFFINDIVKEIINGKYYSTYRVKYFNDIYKIELMMHFNTPESIVLYFDLSKSLNNAVYNIIGTYEHTLYPIQEIRKYKINKLKLL